MKSGAFNKALHSFTATCMDCLQPLICKLFTAGSPVRLSAPDFISALFLPHDRHLVSCTHTSQSNRWPMCHSAGMPHSDMTSASSSTQEQLKHTSLACLICAHVILTLKYAFHTDNYWMFSSCIGMPFEYIWNFSVLLNSL